MVFVYYRGCYRVGEIVHESLVPDHSESTSVMVTPGNFNLQLSCYSLSCHSKKSSLDGIGQSRNWPTIRGNHPCTLEASLDSRPLDEKSRDQYSFSLEEGLPTRYQSHTMRERCALCDYALV